MGALAPYSSCRDSSIKSGCIPSCREFRGAQVRRRLDRHLYDLECDSTVYRLRDDRRITQDYHRKNCESSFGFLVSVCPGEARMGGGIWLNFGRQRKSRRQFEIGSEKFTPFVIA